MNLLISHNTEAVIKAELCRRHFRHFEQMVSSRVLVNFHQTLFFVVKCLNVFLKTFFNQKSSPQILCRVILLLQQYIQSERFRLSRDSSTRFCQLERWRCTLGNWRDSATHGRTFAPRSCPQRLINPLTGHPILCVNGRVAVWSPRTFWSFLRIRDDKIEFWKDKITQKRLLFLLDVLFFFF